MLKRVVQIGEGKIFGGYGRERCCLLVVRCGRIEAIEVNIKEAQC